MCWKICCRNRKVAMMGGAMAAICGSWVGLSDSDRNSHRPPVTPPAAVRPVPNTPAK